jgi:hypothetical protein
VVLGAEEVVLLVDGVDDDVVLGADVTLELIDVEVEVDVVAEVDVVVVVEIEDTTSTKPGSVQIAAKTSPLALSYATSMVFNPLMVATTWLFESEITVRGPCRSATITSPSELSYAIPCDRTWLPTVTVATTWLVESEITLTNGEKAFGTNTSPLALSYTAPIGDCPTFTVATT